MIIRNIAENGDVKIGSTGTNTIENIVNHIENNYRQRKDFGTLRDEINKNFSLCV
jgi:hypothetical protein